MPPPWRSWPPRACALRHLAWARAALDLSPYLAADIISDTRKGRKALVESAFLTPSPVGHAEADGLSVPNTLLAGMLEPASSAGSVSDSGEARYWRRPLVRLMSFIRTGEGLPRESPRSGDALLPAS